MSDSVSPARSTLRTLIVLALCLLLAAIFALDLHRLWSPLGVLGYLTNADGIVIGVTPGSPADRAGMQLGDRVDERNTPPQFRPYVAQGTIVWAAGQRVSFALLHGGVRRMVTLVAAPQDASVLRKVFWVVNFIAAVGFLAIGAALVLLRPGAMTWGFLFYSLAFAPGSWTSFWGSPPPGNYIASLLFTVIQVAGEIGLLGFALLFAAPPQVGWRRNALRFLPWLFVLLLAYWSWTFVQGYWLGGPPAEVLFRIQLGLNAAVSLCALGLFIDSYVRTHGVERQRTRWVIAGFGVSLAATYLAYVFEFYTAVPGVVVGLLFLCNVIVPVTIGYAVIRHRIIDVSFVVSRALVYATLTTMLVVLFSLIDWLFSGYLQLTGLSTVAEVGAAVAVGIWFNALHRRVDGFIDATFFRRRHAAERQLARDAAALHYAASQNAIATALVAEPVRCLSLASAALFRADGQGRYVREASEGWSATDASRLADADEHFLAQLKAENGPLSLDEAPLRTAGLPLGTAHPALALPIISRGELLAVALYGPHLHGEMLDPDEIKCIGALAPGAAAAYDHLAVESMQKKMDAMQRQLDALQRTSSPQIQPAG